jgi:hypothetical protein
MSADREKTEKGPDSADPAARKQDGGDADHGPATSTGSSASPLQAKWATIVAAATRWNSQHPDLVAEFNKLTGGKCSGGNAGISVRAVRIWQMEHGLRKIDGKIGRDTLQAARAGAAPEDKQEEGADAQPEKNAATEGGADHSNDGAPGHGPKGAEKAHAKTKPKTETISFADDEVAGDMEQAALKEVPPEADVDAAKVVSEGDTDHNRKGKEERGIEGEDVEEVADFIVETLDAMGVQHAGKAKFVAKFMHVHSAQDVLKALKEEITPEAVIEVAGKLAKRFGWHAAAEIAEKVAPAVAGASVGLEFAVLSMKYIIGPANEEGRRSAQLNRYAAAWAFRFLDDGYAPQMVAELDEQMQLMNTCTRLGIQDAIKSLAKLGPGAAGMRKQLISHYGGADVARENLVLELLKQAGVK